VFLSVDGTFWIQLINFGLFFLILNSLFLKPVVRAVQERRAYIDGVAGDHARYLAQTRKIDDEAAHLTAEARRSAAEVVAEARNEANAEADVLRQEYAHKAQGVVEAARAKLRAETAHAQTQRPALAAGLADLLLRRIRGGQPGGA
jgi:F0F1-type ATP synthase membrane subunit b/b'